MRYIKFQLRDGKFIRVDYTYEVQTALDRALADNSNNIWVQFPDGRTINLRHVILFNIIEKSDKEETEQNG